MGSAWASSGDADVTMGTLGDEGAWSRSGAGGGDV